MADFLISGLTAVAAPIADTTEFEAQRSGQTITEKYTGQDLKNYLRWQPKHAGYVASNWYLPEGTPTVPTGSVAAGIDSIRLFPFFVSEKMTVSDLAVRVGTAIASQNVQVAIYASSTSTKKPTGNALANTG